MSTGLYGSPELGEFREGSNRYPVQVHFIIPARNSRFYAFPLIGYLARLLLLVPHLLLLAVLGVIVWVLSLLLWIPVLFTGHYPKWGYAVVGGYLRWNVRTQAFFLGLTDAYPPFSTRE
jgi:hypothetical protein